jgi:hypothetical protein
MHERGNHGIHAHSVIVLGQRLPSLHWPGNLSASYTRWQFAGQ